MSDPQEDSHYHWRQIEYEWHHAQDRWRDSTTEYFDTYCWQPLEHETIAYLHALDQLMESLRAAQEIARAR